MQSPYLFDKTHLFHSVSTVDDLMKAIDEAKKNCKKVIEDLEALDKSSTSATNKTSIANSKTKISKAIEGLDKVRGFML